MQCEQEADAVLARSMSYKHGERWRSMSELSSALERRISQRGANGGHSRAQVEGVGGERGGVGRV